MVQVNFENIPEQYFVNYLSFLVNKVYKCLPMKEKGESTLQSYTESLIRELIGNKELICELKGNPIFLSLLGKLNYLTQNNVNIKIYKKEIFDCISLIEKLKEGGMDK